MMVVFDVHNTQRCDRDTVGLSHLSHVKGCDRATVDLSLIIIDCDK